MSQQTPSSASYHIRDLHIAPGLVLAPMSGVTNSSFRRLIKELNPGAVGLVISEFISVEGLTRDSRRSIEMMKFAEMERPYGIQIFGYDVTRMRDAALMAQDAGADLVDINCGCPAPKVVKRGGGCELMRQPEHLQKILASVRSALSIPLTMKFRSGWDEESRNAMQIAKLAEGEGVEAITVHGRTRSQLYRGYADWAVAEEIAASVKIPVCGSGDVVDLDSARERLRGNIAGLYIGRAAISNPFVFSEIVSGESEVLTEQRAVAVLRRYVELLREDLSPQACIGRVKQLASQMCGGMTWKKLICRANTLEEQLLLMEKVEQGQMETFANDGCHSLRASD